MPIRPAFLLASVAALGLGGPALAQAVHTAEPLEVEDVELDVHTEEHHVDEIHGEAHEELHAHTVVPSEHHREAPHTVGHDAAYDGGWDGEWVDPAHFQGAWEGTYHGDARPRRASHDGPLLAYSPAEREQWLADCRILMADGGGYDDRYYHRERGPDGRVIGGVLGAVVGGVVGNRVADGSRLGGTLIGAGLGGLAGAAIGSAVDRDGDRYSEYSRDELWAARYCEAYLRRYELGGGIGFQGYTQPMMVVQAAPAAPHYRQRRRASHCGECRRVVTEEEIEVEVEEAPAPRARRSVPRPAPEPGKRISID